MQAARDVAAKLMKQRTKLQTGFLRDESLQCQDFLRVVFLTSNDAGQIEAGKGPKIERNHVCAKRGRSDVLNNIRRDAVKVLERLDAVGNRVFLGMVERKAVGRLKHTLQHAPQSQRSPGRIGQFVQCFGQFSDRRHAYLIEVEITLQQTAEGLLSQIMRGVLKTAGEEHLL